MPKAAAIQNSFTTGELSPKLLGRTDLDKYKSAVKLSENMIPVPHGPSGARGGTRYIDNTKNNTESVRLVSFEYSTEQAYVLEFGPYYIRFYANKAHATDGSFSEEFAAEFDLAGYAEIVSPYAEADLFDLQFTQSADVLYIAHQSYAPRTLTRISAVDFDLGLFQSTFGPYLDLNLVSSLTITPSGTTGNITLTASSDLFEAGHVGALWRLGTGDGYVLITAFTDSKHVSATVKSTLSGTAATSDWSEGAWSDVRGYPGAVAFFEQRLMWAGSTYQPQTIWGSVSADYTNHLLGVLDADALEYTIASQQVNAIQWISPGELLIVGTTGGIYVASAATRDEGLTPTNVRIVKRTGFGSNGIQPVRVANVAVFIQRGGEKFRQLGYEFESDSYAAADITLLSEHITRGGIIQMAYQQDPDSIIWSVRADGKLIGMTYEKEQNVYGWHRHTIGGASDVLGSDAIVESIAVIPGSSNIARDEIWLVVQRYINGAVVRHVEILEGGHESDGDIEDAYFVDAGLSYNGSPATTFTGLDHLEGESVAVLADGSVHPNVTVTSGSITLTRAASKVHAGIYRDRELGLLNAEAGSNDGTAQGKIKRISHVIIRLYQTVGILFGASSADQLDRISFRSSADTMDDPVPLFTGDKRAPVPKGYDRDGTLYFKQDQPLPFTIVAVMSEVKTNG